MKAHVDMFYCSYDDGCYSDNDGIDLSCSLCNYFSIKEREESRVNSTVLTLSALIEQALLKLTPPVILPNRHSIIPPIIVSIIPLVPVITTYNKYIHFKSSS